MLQQVFDNRDFVIAVSFQPGISDDIGECPAGSGLSQGSDYGDYPGVAEDGSSVDPDRGPEDEIEKIEKFVAYIPPSERSPEQPRKSYYA